MKFLVIFAFLAVAYSASIDVGVETDPTVDYSSPSRNAVRNAIRKTGDVINGGWDITKESVNGGISLGTGAAKLGLDVGQKAMNGGMQIGQDAVDLGKNVTDKALGIVKDIVGDGMMGNMTEGVQKVVDHFTDKTKGVIKNVENWGNSLFGWLNNGVEQGSQFGQKVTDKAVDTAKNITSAITSSTQ